VGLPGRDEDPSRASPATGTPCPQLRKMSVVAAVEKASYCIIRRPATRKEPPLPRPRKYHTDEERREAACRYQRKYREANRKTINRRRAQAYKSKRAAIEAVQKGPSAPSPQGELEDPRAAFLRRRDG
jgi:hypothetical protein